MKEPPLLRVEWIDSILVGAGWRDEMPDVEVPIVSVGFKAEQKDGFLFLAGSWNPGEDHAHWSCVIAIPIRAIVKKRRIGH